MKTNVRWYQIYPATREIKIHTNDQPKHARWAGTIVEIRNRGRFSFIDVTLGDHVVTPGFHVSMFRIPKIHPDVVRFLNKPID